MHRVVVTDHDFTNLDIERDVLDGVADVIDAGDDVDASGTADVEVMFADADGVLNLRYPLEERHVRQFQECRIIARYGIGVDNVDVDAATERGIPVTNVPEYCLEEVATHAITLALALLWGIKPFDRFVATGGWDRSDGPRMHRLSTLTVGIVGWVDWTCGREQI